MLRFALGDEAGWKPSTQGQKVHSLASKILGIDYVTLYETLEAEGL
jgi:hypothetical protein